MRFLALVTSIVVALAVAAFPTSMVRGSSFAPTESTTHSAHHHHHDADGEEVVDLASAPRAMIAAGSSLDDEISDALRAHHTPSSLDHEEVGCCGMSTCHAVALTAAAEVQRAELKPLRNLHVAEFLIPAGFSFRIERPPRAA